MLNKLQGLTQYNSSTEQILCFRVESLSLIGLSNEQQIEAKIPIPSEHMHFEQNGLNKFHIGISPLKQNGSYVQQQLGD
jgi:hypothetical protein